MSKVALAGALGLLMFFTYLTAIRTAFVFGYALCLLFVIAWVWPRLAIRGITVARSVDPGTPTVGEVYEEQFEVRRKGWIPAPWVEVRATQPPPPLPDYEQPPCPEDGYLWTPGYWHWTGSDYYWVPGTWVQPPRVGSLRLVVVE